MTLYIPEKTTPVLGPSLLKTIGEFHPLSGLGPEWRQATPRTGRAAPGSAQERGNRKQTRSSLPLWTLHPMSDCDSKCQSSMVPKTGKTLETERPRAVKSAHFVSSAGGPMPLNACCCWGRHVPLTGVTSKRRCRIWLIQLRDFLLFKREVQNQAKPICRWDTRKAVTLGKAAGGARRLWVPMKFWFLSGLWSYRHVHFLRFVELCT